MNQNLIAAIRKDFFLSKPVIVVDNPCRENEGDLILPASQFSSQAANFFIRFGRGLLCVSITASHAQKMNLNLVSPLKDISVDTTNFTYSVDASDGISTGISAYDRARTINLFSQTPVHMQKNFVTPGHVFPVIAHPEGLAMRRGHTEASLALCKVTDFFLSAAMIEILDDQGHAAGLEYLRNFAQEHDLRLVKIDDIVEYIENSQEGFQL